MERARRERQVHQVGFELVGLPGPGGDLEVLLVAVSAVRAAGLAEFTLDLGHAGIAGSLVALAPAALRGGIVEALAAKDAEEVRRRAERGGIRGKELAALVELPALYGGEDVWARADPLLAGTAAEEPGRALRALADAAGAAGLAPRVLVDLGETWNFAYYTGVLFQILAEGPGEPIGSGGRYDRLFDRFDRARPAAGFGVDVGNLGWALERAGAAPPPRRRLLVVGGPDAAELMGLLRLRGVDCAPAPSLDPMGYAKAWGYSHLVEVRAGSVQIVECRNPCPGSCHRHHKIF